MKRVGIKVIMLLVLVIGSSVRADFADSFDAYAVGTGLTGPATAWTDTSNPSGYPMNVNAYGWQGHGINANSPNWHWSSRPTNYDAEVLEHDLTLKALISSKNGLARHNWQVGNATQKVIFEMDENGLQMSFGTPQGGWQSGGSGFLKDTWYEFDVELTNDGGNNWTWALLRRAWEGMNWGTWSVLGSGATIAGFAPEVVDVGGIWAFDEAGGTSSMDDVAFTGFTTPDPTECSEARAAGLGLAGDVNGDCYVNLEDIAILAQEWVDCMDPANPECGKPWENNN